ALPARPTLAPRPTRPTRPNTRSSGRRIALFHGRRAGGLHGGPALLAKRGVRLVRRGARGAHDAEPLARRLAALARVGPLRREAPARLDVPCVGRAGLSSEPLLREVLAGDPLGLGERRRGVVIHLAHEGLGFQPVLHRERLVVGVVDLAYRVLVL